jgi:hypothetical protein
MTQYVLEQQRRRTNRVRALLLAVTGPTAAWSATGSLSP